MARENFLQINIRIECGRGKDTWPMNRLRTARLHATGSRARLCIIHGASCFFKRVVNKQKKKSGGDTTPLSCMRPLVPALDCSDRYYVVCNIIVSFPRAVSHKFNTGQMINFIKVYAAAEIL